jgi:hypothetical protein
MSSYSDPDPSANEAIRTHFQQLTERFLVPLNRYFQTLIPSSPNPSSMTTSAIKPFSLPSFLSHTKTHGPNPLQFRTKGLSTKSRVESDFYASFGMSATFAGWLAARIESLGVAVAVKSAQTLAVPSASSGIITPRSPGQPSVGGVAMFRDPFGGPSSSTIPRPKEVGLGIRNGAADILVPSPAASITVHGRPVNSNREAEVDERDSEDGDNSSNSHWRPSEESLSRQLHYTDVFGGAGGRRGSEGLAVKR